MSLSRICLRSRTRNHERVCLKVLPVHTFYKFTRLELQWELGEPLDPIIRNQVVFF